MKPVRETKTHTLINFRSPKHIHQSFDHICKLYSLNRSHVLNRLMIEYIVAEKDKINNQIEITNSFKNNTSNFNSIQSDITITKILETKNLQRKNQNNNWSEPYEFFYGGGNE